MKKTFGFQMENTYTDLPEIFYEKLTPHPVQAPQLVLYNEALGDALGLDNEATESGEAVEILAGNKAVENSVPIAQSYAGHQFGHFTMLGDGRAMLLGEHITPDGKRVDIQLKGSGPTPFSRGGDGRAALAPMLREYIISEAMHGLGIPTTRSLAVVQSGEMVQREIELEGAVLTRVAASHLRVGTFQFAAKFGEMEDVVKLADYAIQRHYPQVADAGNPYLALLQQVIEGQAELIAKWQLAGFIHGVMNTDNMTISGETIDYGPCAFMDQYNREAVFSSIDYSGRYMYQNQPGIAAWNLARLSETLLPLLGNRKEEAIQTAQEAISEFGKTYQAHWFRGMWNKLGIFDEEAEDEKLIEELLRLMEHYHADYTNTFLALTYDEEEAVPMCRMDDFSAWKEKWKERLSRQDASEEEVKNHMFANNPALIPRNKWVEDALDQAVQQENFTLVKELVDILQNPYAHTEEQKEFAKRKFETGESYQTFCGT